MWIVDYSFARPSLSLLRQSGGSGIARYATGSGKAISASEYASARMQGLSVVIVQEGGNQPALRGYAGGVADARAANQAADACGYAKNSVIYYVAEDPSRLPSSAWNTVAQYFKGVHSVGGREVGAYGSIALLNDLALQWLISKKWAVGPWGGYYGADLSQYSVGLPSAFASSCDGDLCLNQDWGQDPRPNQPAPINPPPVPVAPGMLLNCVAMVPTPTDKGYWLIQADGGVFSHGDAVFHGSLGGVHLNKPIIGACGVRDTGGYRLVGADGGVFNFSATDHGSVAGKIPNADICGIVDTHDDGGYWLVGSDGGVFTLGDAPFDGSAAGHGPLVKPVVGVAGTPSGQGYYLCAADGGVFCFGDAVFYGSLSGISLKASIVGMDVTPDGKGYYLVGADGGVFCFGQTGFFGSLGGVSLKQPVKGIKATQSGKGYWLFASDGGLFSFGDAGFYGAGQ